MSWMMLMSESCYAVAFALAFWAWYFVSYNAVLPVSNGHLRKCRGRVLVVVSASEGWNTECWCAFARYQYSIFAKTRHVAMLLMDVVVCVA